MTDDVRAELVEAVKEELLPQMRQAYARAPQGMAQGRTKKAAVTAVDTLLARLEQMGWRVERIEAE